MGQICSHEPLNTENFQWPELDMVEKEAEEMYHE